MSGPDQTAVYVISSGRPLNVAPMTALLTDPDSPGPVTWVVPADQARTYTEAGARSVIGVDDPPPGASPLSRARNTALDHAEAAGHLCCQVDDDLRALYRLTADRTRAPAQWPTVRQALAAALTGDQAPYLAGIAPTSNPLSARHTQTDWGFVIGSLCLTRPGSGVRFDETLPLKEDYDYTCRHLEAHGRIARLNWLFADMAHYTNRGGAVAYRTAALEARTAARLLERWPDYLKPHPRRDHEVSFRPRPKKASL